ncbi:MAG TPA: PQQ-dependent sugar dehydrogenase, partial [Candidatus Eisenbacteria bacterium]|nr:PQQ-dependent sugar dehydrogenase [Candidatus Eisenbacteria bacterium]
MAPVGGTSQITLNRRRIRLQTIVVGLGLVGIASGSAAQVTTPTPALLTPLPGINGTLDSPVFVGHSHLTDPDHRLFIVEQSGAIRIYKNATLQPTPFLNISGIVDSGGDEQGLLSFAFDPNYPSTPYFYVYYTSQSAALPGPTPDIGEGDIVVARYTVSGNPDIADPSSAKHLLHVPHQNAGNHNGGQVAFGSDGYLYTAPGDGGFGCDTTGAGCNAQRDNLFLGKMLRIDVHVPDPTPYA